MKMNDIEYVKQIKSANWEKKEPLPMEYLIDFLTLLEDNLNPINCSDPKYLNNLFTIITIKLAKIYKIQSSKGQLNNIYLTALHTKRIKQNILFESMILVKPTRSNSGELETTTTLPGKGISCQYDCAMCPNQPEMPRSYLASEGSIIQGIIEEFDGFRQTLRRFILYEYKMGHTIDKILHILLGGTFHSYDSDIIEDYITKLYYCSNIYNDFSIRNHGKYVHVVQEWLNKKPFLHHIPVTDGELGEIISNKLRKMGSLEEEKELNTYSICGRITGLVIETRPDQIGYHTIYNLRRYGVTRVQLGIQHTDDTILKILNRQHYTTASIKAIKSLRDNGFKIDGHLMPNCPGSTEEKDLVMLQNVFLGEDLQLDYCKLYICVHVPYTEIEKWKQRTQSMIENGNIKDLYKIDEWMKNGDFQSLENYALHNGYKKKEDIYVWIDRAEIDYKQFENFMVKSLRFIPPWTRLNRMFRDFPEATTKNKGIGYSSATLKTNLQQICIDNLIKKGLRSYDIRSREIRNRIFLNLEKQACIYIRKYRANDGIEYFISVEVPNHKNDINDSVILGLIRLRIPDYDLNHKKKPSYLLNTFKKHTVLRVRELHVYGNLSSHGIIGNSQHKGIGKFLLKIAEYVGYYYKLEKIAVIAGIGVQDYYKKNGYYKNSLHNGEYMIKDVENPTDTKLFGIIYTYHDFYYSVFVFKQNLFVIFRNIQLIKYYQYDTITVNKPELFVLKKRIYFNNIIIYSLLLILFTSIYMKTYCFLKSVNKSSDIDAKPFKN